MSDVQPSCGICARAHLVQLRKALARPGETSPALQCRALPPRPDDLVSLSHYPVVGPDDYCHVHYQAGEPRKAEIANA